MSESSEEQSNSEIPAPRRRRLLRACLWMAFGALLTVTVLGATAAMLLDVLEQRPQYIADWLSRQIGRSVSLRSLELSWNDGAPLLRLEGLKVQATGLQAGGLVLERSEIRFDPLSSLRMGSPQLSKITIQGADIHLRQSSDGQWLLAGLGSQGRYRADAVIGQALAAIPPGAEFSLENASVSIDGVLNSGPRAAQLRLSPVSVQLRNLAQSSRLSGAIGLPGMRRQPLRFSLRWAPETGTPIAQSKLALIATQLPLSRIPWLAGLLDLDALDGELGLTLDIDIRNGAVASAAGRLELRQLALSLGREWPLVQLDALNSVVEFSSAARGWRLKMLKLVIENQQQTWPQTSLSLTRVEDKLVRYDRVTLDQLPIAALIPFLKRGYLPVDLRERLSAGLKTRGRLESIELTRTLQQAQEPSTTLSMGFQDLSYRDPASGIRIDAARGTLTLLDQGGRLSIENSRVRFADDSEHNLNLNITGSGDLRWHHAGDQLVVDLDNLQLRDRIVRFNTRGRIRLPGTTRKVSADLQASLSDVSTEDLKPYLNAGLASPHLAEWVSQSLRGGGFSNLKASLKGELESLNEIPGLISINGQFQNVTMDYAKGWPSVSKLEGEMGLVAKRFQVKFRKGTVAGARVRNVRGQITDISKKNKVIRLAGKIQGRSEQAAAFISASPLKSRFSGLLNNLQLTGPTTLMMEMDIPLSAQPLAVRGTMNIRANRMQVPALRSGMREVAGKLTFDSEGPGQGQFTALYLDREIRLDIDGGIDSGTITRLTIRGQTDPAGLARHLYNVGAINSNNIQFLPVFKKLSGETDWKVVLDIPVQWASGTQLGLLVESGLQGMALDLPAPLGKSSDELRLLSIRTRIGDQPVRRFKIDYGERLNAVLEVKPDGPNFRLSRGEVILDSVRAELPAREGLYVRGSLAYLSVDEWVGLLSQYQNNESVPANGIKRARPMAEVGAVTLAAGSLDALGSRFKNVQLNVVHNNATGWNIALKGKDLEGRIKIPEVLSGAVIQARFRRLSIQPSPRTMPAADIDPRGLPSLDLVIDKLRYKDLELGLTKLLLQPTAQGALVQQLFVLNDAFEIRGWGDWLRRDGKTRSALRLEVNGNDFGKLVTAIGYPGTGADGGAVELLIEGRWPGSPFDFDTATFLGTLHFRTSGGYLRDIKPGVTGRLFGLFTLTTLPRRLLLLDFSDLFEEGLGYNLIEGSFNLEAGNAYTNNLKMETDTARVEIEGRVGLVLRDYDQVMTVTPKLSSSLPLAPLWLAEKILNRDLINNAFSYRYTISGSWDKPDVKRIRVVSPKPEMK